MTFELLELMLSFQPYQVITASNGWEAMQWIDTLQPDLIFLDLLMLVMDGFEACRRIRSHPATRTTPIIVLSISGRISLDRPSLASRLQ